MANTPTERMYQLLVRPLVTEKTTKVAEAGNWLTFEVLLDATKPEIKQAVQRLYGVDVERVNTLIQKGKKKTRALSARTDVKKAIIKLKDGQNIDLSAGAK
ncbi:MAG: 50S ribosomal protein L23 [Alphaproteobacteria bacterium]|nr:MAG: 50S ribosomal protein L23 [Alphaproteobacteria bacterium]